MALLLMEGEVLDLLPMDRALDCVERSFMAQAHKTATNRPRDRILLPQVSLHYMAGALAESQRLGMKVYTVTRENLRFLVLLFDTDTGKLLALIQADHLGRIRTGAASGIASKFLARPEASQVGLIGTGRQARTQLEAVAKVRNLRGVKAFSRDHNRLRAFCCEMEERLGMNVEPASGPEEAARYGDIVITVTSSQSPVLQGEWLRAGTHINAVGANAADRREVDDAVLSRAGLLAVDSVEQSRKESGDLIEGLAHLGRSWEEVVELHSIVAGKHPGRSAQEQITLFKSHGIALWDVAVATYVYERALAEGKGKTLDID